MSERKHIAEELAEIGKDWPTQSDTPRTDALYAEIQNGGVAWDTGPMLDHARKLERELAAERKRADDLMEVIRAVSKGVQPCDYGKPDAAIRRFQAMIDGVMTNV